MNIWSEDCVRNGSRKKPVARHSYNRLLNFEEDKNASVADELEYAGHILVVDDEPDIRQLNTEILTEAGYDVDTAENGIMAWKALQQKKYDLIITDNEMPQMSGVELLEQLHARRKFLPVILATGTMPATELNDQPWFQVVTTLLKPYTLSELLGAVRKIIRTPSVASRQ